MKTPFNSSPPSATYTAPYIRHQAIIQISGGLFLI